MPTSRSYQINDTATQKMSPGTLTVLKTTRVPTSYSQTKWMGKVNLPLKQPLNFLRCQQNHQSQVPHQNDTHLRAQRMTRYRLKIFVWLCKKREWFCKKIRITEAIRARGVAKHTLHTSIQFFNSKMGRYWFLLRFYKLFSELSSL